MSLLLEESPPPPPFTEGRTVGNLKLMLQSVIEVLFLFIHFGPKKKFGKF